MRGIEVEMMTMEINVRANKAKFIRWLQHFVDATRSGNIPTPHGVITISAVTVASPGEQCPSVAIDGIESIRPDVLEGMTPTARQLADVLYDNYQRQVTGLISFWLRSTDKRLHVRAVCNDPALALYFETLVTAIDNRWVEKATAPGDKASLIAMPTPDVPPNRPTGRPANADDEWAWREVRLHGRRPKDVYAEWLRRIGSRADMLADPGDSFRKAIKPNRLVGKLGELGKGGSSSAGR
jgi:hypothetical protein